MNDSTEAFEALRKSLAAARIEHLALARDCTALRLPGGEPVSLERDSEVTLIREIGDAYVVQVPVLGGEYRIDGCDADALGKRPPGEVGRHASGTMSTPSTTPATPEGPLRERVRESLELVNDPELPVSIVDLGLIYAIDLNELPVGTFRAEIEMTLTTQACGMGAMISREVRRVVGEIAEIADVEVRIVWEPRWTPHRITDQGRRKLGME